MIVGVLLLLLTSSPLTSATTPVSYATYVAAKGGRCIFMTGDVLFDDREFERDLRARFDPKAGMLIYVEPSTPARCVLKAEKIVRKVGFQRVEAKPAPAGLNMGPPSSGNSDSLP